jgi:hypothetical protein
MQTPIDALVFLPRYQELCMVLTNPHLCPYAKGSPHEGQAPRTGNSIESSGPSLYASGALLLAPLRRPLSSLLGQRHNAPSLERPVPED